jgi:hypothetical protein
LISAAPVTFSVPSAVLTEPVMPTRRVSAAAALGMSAGSASAGAAARNVSARRCAVCRGAAAEARHTFAPPSGVVDERAYGSRTPGTAIKPADNSQAPAGARPRGPRLRDNP